MVYSFQGPSQITHTVISLADSLLSKFENQYIITAKYGKTWCMGPYLIILTIKEQGVQGGNVYYIALSSYTVF